MLRIMFDILLHTRQLCRSARGVKVSSSDIGIAEQEPDLFECLVLGFGEKEVTDDGVGDTGADVDDEVFVTEVSESVRSDLSDDDLPGSQVLG